MATLIHDVVELQNMNLDLTGDYELANDIDASATAGWNGGLGFAPIGSWPAPWFTGSFDGKGFTITGLTINRPDFPDADYVGLFGYTRDVTIQNVTLANCNIIGDNWVGALVGYYDCQGGSGSINNCSSSGTIRAYGPAGPFFGSKAGGLIGLSYMGSILNSFSSADVQAAMESGGFIGIIQRSIVTNCYASGNATTEPLDPDQIMVGGFAGWISNGIITRCCASGNATGYADVAGFAGRITGNSALIRRCYAVGNALAIEPGGGIARVGGFCGRLDGSNGAGPTVEDCYAKGNATTNGSYAGGCIGTLTDGATIARCYSIGQVAANALAGGFCGFRFDAPAPTNCFWDTETSGILVSPGGGIGKTTAQMKTKVTFTGWDFATVWQMCEPPTYVESYPWLQENDKCEGHICTPAPPTGEALIISFTG